MLPRDGVPSAVRRLDYRLPAYLVEAVELAFDLDPISTLVTASLSFRRNPAALARDGAGRNPPFVLDGKDQHDLTVALDDAAVACERYTLTDATLTLYDPPASGQLTIRSRIHPAANTALDGLYVSSGAFCTQCEPEGFRRITYFPDRPESRWNSSPGVRSRSTRATSTFRP
jgi:aminopeptidase N